MGLSHGAKRSCINHCVSCVVLVLLHKALLETGRRKSGPVYSFSINLHLLSAGAHAGKAAHSSPCCTPDPTTVTLSPQLSSICLHALTCYHNNHWGFAVYVGRRAKRLKSAEHVNYFYSPPAPTRVWVTWYSTDCVTGGGGGGGWSLVDQSRTILALGKAVDTGLVYDFRVLLGISWRFINCTVQFNHVMKSSCKGVDCRTSFTEPKLSCGLYSSSCGPDCALFFVFWFLLSF